MIILANKKAPCGGSGDRAMSNVVSREEIFGICRAGQKELCCRYLAVSDRGITCEKHTPFAQIMDQQVADGKFVARGDNCPGKRRDQP
jgi:hypothetical protein